MCIADTPSPPYVAAIFTSKRSAFDEDGYDSMADQMLDLAGRQPGFLGVESVRNEAGVGITVSYWKDVPSVDAWKHAGQHLAAQKLGRDRWYEAFGLRICHVQRDSFMPGRSFES